jgi:para-nitrobenzyl esterase
MEKRYASPYYSFRDHWNYDDVSEDCLRLNVFTPALDAKKRPVLVWLHGGGFVNGNGIEQDGYNGENLARFGDIVFVSINHRLGPLGYCNLAGVGGEKFAASGNVGMLDIVASLEWVRDNIAGFGGDPGSVTIMGQSGGGAKVCTLTAMPSAKGLFHRAVVLSGASVRAGEKDYAEKLGAYVVKEAALAPGQLDKLQQIPWKEYYDMAARAQRKLVADMAAARAPAVGDVPPATGGVPGVAPGVATAPAGARSGEEPHARAPPSDSNSAASIGTRGPNLLGVGIRRDYARAEGNGTRPAPFQPDPGLDLAWCLRGLQRGSARPRATDALGTSPLRLPSGP